MDNLWALAGLPRRNSCHHKTRWLHARTRARRPREHSALNAKLARARCTRARTPHARRTHAHMLCVLNACMHTRRTRSTRAKHTHAARRTHARRGHRTHHVQVCHLRMHARTEHAGRHETSTRLIFASSPPIHGAVQRVRPDPTGVPTVPSLRRHGLGLKRLLGMHSISEEQAVPSFNAHGPLKARDSKLNQSHSKNRHSGAV